MSTNNTRQAAWVALGSLSSFLVGIISAMFLSRYFDKGDYGTYKQVMYVYYTLLGVFTLGLPRAYSYFIPRTNISEAHSLINKISSIFVVLGAVFSLFLFFASNAIASFLANPDLAKAIRIFSPTPFLLLPTMGIEGIFASFKKTSISALFAVVTRVFVVVCTVVPVVVFHSSYVEAIIGFDVASLLTFILAISLKTWPVRKEKRERTSVTYKDILSFSFPLLYASIWGIILSSTNQFFISRYFGNEVFAEFSNGYMEIPVVGMVISAIATVLLPIFSGKGNNGIDNESVSLWRAALVKSAKIIFPILIFSCVFAKPFMTCLYGDKYEISFIYFIIKNAGGLFFIIPFAPVIIAIGKTKEYANAHMIAALVIVSAEFLCVKFFPSPIFIAIISELCQLLKIALLIHVILVFSKQRINTFIPIKEILKILVVSLAAALFARCVFLPVDEKFIVLIFGGITFIISYYIACYWFRISYRQIVFSFIGENKLNTLAKLIP